MPSSPSAEGFYTPEMIQIVFKNSIPQDYFAMLRVGKVKIPIAPQDKILTVMFTDIVGYTKLMESMIVDRFAALLNEHLTMINSVVIAHGGYVDKFVGDEAMVIWGAPIDCDPAEQAFHACSAALEIVEKSAQMGITVGVGINTGRMAIGNFAADAKPMYTVIGDEVNYGAWLEGAGRNKAGNLISISESTQKLLGDRLATRPVVVRDIPKATGVEEIRVFHELIRDTCSIDLTRYAEASKALAESDFENALTILTSLVRATPEDTVLRYMYNEARRGFVEQLGDTLKQIRGNEEILNAFKSNCEKVFGEIVLALAQYDERAGNFQFLEDGSLEHKEVVFSPDSNFVAWVRGLSTAGSLRDDDVRKIPELAPVDQTTITSLNFSIVCPLRFRNEVKAILFARIQGSTADPVERELFGELTEAIQTPFQQVRLEEAQSRLHNELSDAQRLALVNRQLEEKSVHLQAALDSLSKMNEELEARVKEHVQRLERAIRLKRYLPPALVDQVIEGQRRIEPETERRKITVFFSDIHNFTPITDTMQPEELENLLNEYLTHMSQIAFRQGGTIDKFRGDGMMIFFGAPEQVEPKDAAVRCVRMAIEMRRTVEALKRKWDDDGFDWPLTVRVGINTGYATVGEFGCEDRMDYTAIGSEVNLASRLESSGEVGEITISHSTHALVKDCFRCEAKGEITVKGFNRPIRIYRVEWRTE